VLRLPFPFKIPPSNFSYQSLGGSWVERLVFYPIAAKVGKENILLMFYTFKHNIIPQKTGFVNPNTPNFLILYKLAFTY